MQIAVVVLAMFTLVGVAIYCFGQWNRYGYILSPFNIAIFIFLFALVISPAFLVDDNSWTALGINSAAGMQIYTIKSLFINLLGFSSFFMFYNLLRGRLVKGRFVNGAVDALSNVASRIDGKAVHLASILAAVVFISICMLFNEGEFPLINGNRGFYIGKEGVSQLYQITCSSISLLALYYGIACTERLSNLIPFGVLLTCSLLSGNRSGALISILYPSFVLFVSARIRNKGGADKDIKAANIKSQIIIMGVCFILLLAGMMIAMIRANLSVGGLYSVIKEIINGNTFSDIRDGAFILKGYSENLKDTPVLGMTYLAGILSFLPGAVAPFKEDWLWGPFSVETVGWPDSTHYGFRGGWFIESYVNFDLFGVVVLAGILALLFYFVDVCYRRCFVSDSNNNAKCGILIGALVTMTNGWLCTAQMYESYIQVCVTIGLILLSFLFTNTKARAKGDTAGAGKFKEIA